MPASSTWTCIRSRSTRTCCLLGLVCACNVVRIALGFDRYDGWLLAAEMARSRTGAGRLPVYAVCSRGR
jgi:hypothetical protein